MKSFILVSLLASIVVAIPRPVALHPRPHSITRRQNQIIPVIVGGTQDTFVPNSLVAAVGDVIQFQFSNGNHTVTQSTADKACTPMTGGVHSGHIPFKDNQTEVGTFNMVVGSKEPMFLYCATGPHCQLGQVMVINPASAQQVATYTKLSQASGKSVDGTNVVGGTVGKIALSAAAFVPAPPKSAAGGPPGAPPAAGPPAAAAPASGSNVPPVLSGIL